MSFPESRSWVWRLWREVWALAAIGGIPVPSCQLHTVLLLSPPQRQTVKAGQEPRAGPRSPAWHSPYGRRSASPTQISSSLPHILPFQHCHGRAGTQPASTEGHQRCSCQSLVLWSSGLWSPELWGGQEPESLSPRTGLISRQPLHSQKRSESRTEAALRGNFQPPLPPRTEGPILPPEGSPHKPNLATVVSRQHLPLCTAGQA